ncbi:hydantoinase/carbamoylase family amidase [Tardiphaga sp.]|uniref:hydantoinase/carbamoylase family amidase n=1 Tax=Tardiphaga sp. TaxID=1926292 RepID=UPI0025E40878|nr:hydantoinase/carbamoylase family amidase [Tardiphaga sp.]
MQLDTNRFLRDLRSLRDIGRYRTGVHRPTYGAEDMASRHWLCERLVEVGLEPSIDGIGNVFGRGPATGTRLLAGSHLETQNHAGWLDGALGVVGALALARAGLPVDVCTYADEEGHYGNMIGSRSLIGDLSEQQIDLARNKNDGTSLRDALASAGLAGRPRLMPDLSRYKAAIEMHIEQGTQLESANHRVGVITGIVAIQHWRITFEGQQDHTGGTTMGERRDAGLSAVRFLSQIDQEFPRICGERTVWTTGRIVLEPNSTAIIPGRAEIDFSFRDLSSEVMERLRACLRRLLQESNRRERCTATMQQISELQPTLCDPAILDAFSLAAGELCPDHWQKMPSGAIHDSNVLGRRLPVGMLFVPSINGISHHWSEDTKEEDLVMGMQVFARGAEAYLANG